MDHSLPLSVYMAEWLVVDRECDLPVEGANVRLDLEAGSPEWVPTQGRRTEFRDLGVDELGRSRIEATGIARLFDHNATGFYLHCGSVWIWVYTDGSDVGPGRVPRPAEGQWVTLETSLNVVPNYVAEDTFDRLMLEWDANGRDSPDDRWQIVGVRTHTDVVGAIDGWTVSFRRPGSAAPS